MGLIALVIIFGGIFFVMSQRSNTMNHSESEQYNSFNNQNQQDMDWAMEEARKSATPFEHGGYDMTQGNSFNEPDFNSHNDFHNDFNNDFHNNF